MSPTASVPRQIFYLPESHFDHAVAQLRAVAPATALDIPLVNMRDEAHDGLFESLGPDELAGSVMLVHRMINGYYSRARRLIESAARRGLPIVYETDDLLLNVPACHPDKAYLDDRLLSTLEVTLCADVVTTSTVNLQARLQAFHPDVHVVPNRLPVPIWEAMATGYERLTRGAEGGRRARIGYLGTATHRPDLESIEPALIDVLNAHPEVELVSFGVPLPARLGRLSNARYVQPTRLARRSYQEYAREVAGLGIDIGIAPLIHSEFNRCKSLIKVLEYGALGLAGVYSDVEPYRSGVLPGVTGLLANDLDQWRRSLELLIESSTERRRIRENVHDEVRDQGTLFSADNREAWRQAWRAAITAAQQTARAFEVPQQRDLLDIVRREIDRNLGARGEYPPRRKMRKLQRLLTKAQRWWQDTLTAFRAPPTAKRAA